MGDNTEPGRRYAVVEMVFYLGGVEAPSEETLAAIEALARLVPGVESFRIERQLMNLYDDSLPDGKKSIV